MSIRKDRAWREAEKIVARFLGDRYRGSGITLAIARAIRRATKRAVRAVLNGDKLLDGQQAKIYHRILRGEL
jgi:hypothetical protein